LTTISLAEADLLSLISGALIAGGIVMRQKKPLQDSWKRGYTHPQLIGASSPARSKVSFGGTRKSQQASLSLFHSSGTKDSMQLSKTIAQGDPHARAASKELSHH
jgi:hypothetical protein